MKLYLRDRNASLVEGWQKSFGPMPGVEVSQGDIFGRSADAIVSPANSFGFMDGGIDLVYSEHFGWDLQERLQTKIRNDFAGELPVGLATIVETRHADIPFLVSAPTMRVPLIVDETVNAYLAFRAALIAVEAHNNSGASRIESILCPGLGTAVGRMRPDTCARQMRWAFDSIHGQVAYFPSRLGEARDQHYSMLK